MKTIRRYPGAALVIAGALALSACAGDEPAEFAADDASQSAGEQGEDGADGGDGAASSEGEDSAAAESTATDEETAEEVEPAEPRTIEVGETLTHAEEDMAFTVTVHRVLIHDYYLETEVTIVNDEDERLMLWYGAESSGPQLYDDRGRRYAFQVQPGGSGETFYLEPREGVDAVLIHSGRLTPEAGQVTIDFSEVALSWSRIVVDVPLGGAR